MAVAPGMMQQMLSKLTQANPNAGGMSALGALGQGFQQMAQGQQNNSQMAAQLAQQMPPPSMPTRGTASSGVGAVLPQQMAMLQKRPGDLGLVG